MHYKISIDEFPTNPRDEENLGTIAVVNNRYISADSEMSSIEIEQILADVNYISLPLYAYIHGCIIVNTTGFSCPWDSGQIGAIFVSKKDARDSFRVKRITKKMINTISDYLKQEVSIFNNYLNNEVYGYSVINDDGAELDSCWGYYSREYAEEAAKDSLNYFLNKAA